MPERSLISYIHSAEFQLDFMPFKIDDDTVEWSVIRGRTGKKLEWINGYLHNVSSQKRVRGTVDEFASFITKKLKKTFENDYEYPYCEGMVRSMVDGMNIMKPWEV